MTLSATPASARIDVLDMVRGLAVLGIFILNICGFALPSAAYMNPVYIPSASGTDVTTWAVLNVLVQGKFLGMFALLFGATLMMLSRAVFCPAPAGAGATDTTNFAGTANTARNHQCGGIH